MIVARVMQLSPVLVLQGFHMHRVSGVSSFTKHTFRSVTSVIVFTCPKWRLNVCTAMQSVQRRRWVQQNIVMYGTTPICESSRILSTRYRWCKHGRPERGLCCRGSAPPTLHRSWSSLPRNNASVRFRVSTVCMYRRRLYRRSRAHLSHPLLFRNCC